MIDSQDRCKNDDPLSSSLVVCVKQPFSKLPDRCRYLRHHRPCSRSQHGKRAISCLRQTLSVFF